MLRIYVFIALLLIGSAAYAKPLSENEKIAQLLDMMETANVIFIRSGEEHSGSEAKSHLQMKLGNAGTRIKTADDFITHLASKSSMTGKLYYIKLPDGTMVESGKWLHKKLAEIEAD